MELSDIQKGFDIAGQAQDSLKVIVTPICASVGQLGL